MSNPTSNFGWQMPTPTDLVTDLPADFEVFGQAVDTSLADLKGGTTGQILSKATNADMDFTWTNANPGDITEVTAGTGITGGGTSGAVTITNDMATTITAAGDIVVGTGSGTYDNLPIGTTGQILTADTTVSPYKVKWATPAGGGGKVLQVVSGTTTTQKDSATSTYVDSNLTATITPSSATSKVLVMVAQNGLRKSNASASNALAIRLMRDASQLQEIFYINYTNSALALATASASFVFLDSPATTSATTYKTQIKSQLGTSDVGVQYNDASSAIVLLEIGA